MVHVRDAWDDCLKMLEDEGAAGGIIHCFSGTLDQAHRSLALGFYLSIPGIVTFKNPGDLPEAVRQCPRDRLLLETDSPYLASMPHRGKRNEPAFVAHVAAKVAELWETSVAEVLATTGENAQRVFSMA